MISSIELDLIADKVAERVIQRLGSLPTQQLMNRSELAKALSMSVKSVDRPVNAFKKACQRAAKQVFKGELLSGPLSVSVLFVFARPTNKVWKSKPMPRYRHEKKPDIDNVTKAVFDALSGVIWMDDKQICESRQRKVIAAGDEKPHCIVIVEELDQ